MGFISDLFGGGAYEDSLRTLENDKRAITGMYGAEMYKPMGADSGNQAIMSYGRKSLADQMAQSDATGELIDSSTAVRKAGKEAAALGLAQFGANLNQNYSSNKNNAMQGYYNALANYDTAINQNRIAEGQAISEGLKNLVSSTAGVASTALKV